MVNNVIGYIIAVLRTNETAQWGKALVTKPDDLALILGVHLMALQS